MVPQTPANALPPTVPALRLVTDVLHWSRGYEPGAARATATELLDEVGIHAESYYKRPHQLSGGMAMRVAIAAALATRPWFLVLDEPSSGLDPIVRRKLADLLLSVADQASITLVVVTHDLWMVNHLCERVIAVEQGRVAADGDPSQLASTRIGRIAREHSEVARQMSSRAAASSAEHHDAEPVLTFEGVSVDYTAPGSVRRKVRALSDVSLALRAGQSVGVIGPSGAGKSTLALTAAGLLRPAMGAVIRNPTRPPHTHGRRANDYGVRMVFQNPFATINPRYTVGRWLEKAISRDRRDGDLYHSVVELLQMVDLPDAVRHARPAQLSGGQCQRAVIAACLASGADVLVMDEPVSMLDPVARDEVIAVLRELRQRQRWSYLLVSHDILSIMQLCEFLVVLDRGCVVECGPLDRIVACPQRDITRRLMEAYYAPTRHHAATSGSHEKTCSGDSSGNDR